MQVVGFQRPVSRVAARQLKSQAMAGLGDLPRACHPAAPNPTAGKDPAAVGIPACDAMEVGRAQPMRSCRSAVLWCVEATFSRRDLRASAEPHRPCRDDIRQTSTLGRPAPPLHRSGYHDGLHATRGGSVATAQGGRVCYVLLCRIQHHSFCKRTHRGAEEGRAPI